MTTPATPDFRLYPSNVLGLLAALLADELRRPVPGQSPLAPDVVLIPQVAMRRWLQATLAAEYGIAANLEFLTPGEFVARALDANLGPAGEDDLDAASLQWRLYAALGEPGLRRDPALATLDGWLADGDPLKPWRLAGELAGVYEKYQAWRRDWLLRWEAGADRDDPQARLWRAVAAGRDYRARRIDAYLARFGRDDGPLPQGLPKRLLVFATLNISPDVLRVLATQARVGTLHFYLPTPARGYWGDLQTLRERRRDGEAMLFADDVQENPLLQAWGAAGRDFMALLGDYEVVHPRAEIDVYADPLDETGPDTLLHRLQSDLFHRRAPAVPPPHLTPDLTDASLQVHACHTRLRELQVLHDQLRALLEDPRFDPPLQPRDIAVLAPDIDPYVPYLDAVFGGSGHDDALPWALADTSPLASEPLAEVFLRLLDLPLSRFGLDEVLDLLASAPVAEAAGLDTDAIDRLHGWLRDAGARWGLDATHRAASDAPADDAYTWQFALDRLLLGHASGADDAIAGVAPWPQLEGSALDALDTLVRLLRELARQRRALGEALTPSQWRERLLHLLAVLLPEQPSSPRAQRALDRLRTLIDRFARDADTAGYGGGVPPEVVRAHFADLLSQADTRAPLLTGGISVGRMVPMRLLPFRAICLLGMNDGDFPRRDPAAGLNKLTAELHAGRRQPGDRSTREDDRFLFLQLFAAAQDVFYLSYLGADPRDGSVREPSVLLSELLDVAARYHADAEAKTHLVVRHTLQPFAPAAFGSAGEPRRFSYRAAWRPAADRVDAARRALPPWAEASLSLPTEDEHDLPLDALRRFLLDPAQAFLTQRLGLRLPESIEQTEDTEPLTGPARGRDRAQVRREAFDWLLDATHTKDARMPAALYAHLRARGQLPTGPLGEAAAEQVLVEVEPYAAVFADWLGQATREDPDAASRGVVVDGARVHGRIADVYPHGLVRVHVGALNGPAVLRHGLDALLLNACGVPVPLVQIHDGADGIRAYVTPARSVDEAQAALRVLLALRRDGLRAPLPFAPHTGWAVHTADPALRAEAAREAWYPGDYRWGESTGDAIQLAFRGRDPLADAEGMAAFIDTSLRVFAAVRGAGPEGAA
ncbi:exodeoxyribonuclease V subunit gamma [Pseudoxanthomonas sp. PXM02]|uniref:exodeoxyribonuclease V subunit gamma n=1 Tax=Pseudoxanthomonas sp. PXM02 TaxID=2769294 RepID=UPI00177BB3D4|nr:exodeoxyribonuclease V subunit gamma [Pseudoxanthomonas sp. PXM02]MBD9480584.1 exodeoxyribonuclease V subunit gamma [Pseudoxanthomonas sp. PXM02]